MFPHDRLQEKKQAVTLAPGIQETFIEYLLHARHQAGPYKYKDESDVVPVPEES